MENNLIPIKHNNQLILTTEQVAKHFGTKTNNIIVNFRNNKERFIEGTDYYLLQGTDLKDFKDWVNDINLVANRTPSLYLWTERGSLKHMKILGTDEAWQGYDILTDTYFKVKQNQIALQIPKNFAEALRLAADQQEKIEQLEDKNNHMKKVTQSATTTAGIIKANANKKVGPRKDEVTVDKACKKIGIYSSKGNPHKSFLCAVVNEFEHIKADYDGDYYRSGLSLRLPDYSTNIVIKKSAGQEIEDWINDSRNYTIHIKNNETKYVYNINGCKHHVYRTKNKER